MIAPAFVEVEPGGMREIHWHPNADAMPDYICGQARVTLFAAEAKAGTLSFPPSRPTPCRQGPLLPRHARCSRRTDSPVRRAGRTRMSNPLSSWPA
jgi:hypothetical protein